MARGVQRDLKREAFWRDALARQRNSGLNVSRWCAHERLPQTAFYFWRRTLAQRDRQAAVESTPVRQPSPQAIRQPAPQAGFVPVVLVGAKRDERSGRIAIRLVGGRVMRLPAGMDVAQVAELVHAIEGSSTVGEA